MSFTARQVDQLLCPINPNRVLKDAKGHSHVSQQDITAHLIRLFGFGNFDIDVKETECLFEEQAFKNGLPAEHRMNVCYRALVRLTVRDPDGDEVCHYENGSTATAQNQTRGDAHDLAYKSAISLSIKRAAIALGDQLGLSLYNKGQMTSLVMGTLVHPLDDSAVTGDVQDGVEQQVAMGNDEIETEPPTEGVSGPPAKQNAPPRQSPADNARTALRDLLNKQGFPLSDAVMKYRQLFDGELKDSTDAEKITAVTDSYREAAE
jgi:hypothetical protein